MSASELRLYARLQRAAHALKTTADRALLSAAEVTTAQAAVLVVVGGRDRPTQREVADALGLNEPGMAAMTHRLIAQGLLERTRSDEDRRVWRLSLTDRGRETLRAVEAPFGSVNRRMEEALNPGELAALAKALERLTEAFEKR